MIKVRDTHLLFGKDHWLSMNKRELPYSNYTSCYGNMEFEYSACVLPFPSSIGNSYIEENMMIAEYVSNHTIDIPVFAFNPNNVENVDQVFKLLPDLKRSGVIIWPILCGLNIRKLPESTAFNRLLEKFGDHLVANIHTGAGNEKAIGRVGELGRYMPEDLLYVAERFPNVNFVFTHLLRGSLPCLKAAKSMNNVWIDTSGVTAQKNWYENGMNVFPSADAGELAELSAAELVEYATNKIGLGDKLIFGSSYPYSKWWGFDVEDEIRLILNCNISDDNKAKILYENSNNLYEW